MDETMIGLHIISRQDGISACSLGRDKKIDGVTVTHDRTDGKNEVTVEVNGQVVFRYDSLYRGESQIINHVQHKKEESQ